MGLTGGIASGKSTAAKLLAEHGAAVVDCDVLGHRAYAKALTLTLTLTLTYRTYAKGTRCLEDLVEAFGDSILGVDGGVERAALGQKVFGDQAAMSKLNRIVWPAIKALAAAEIASHAGRHPIVVMEAAVLLEALRLRPQVARAALGLSLQRRFQPPRRTRGRDRCAQNTVWRS